MPDGGGEADRQHGEEAGLLLLLRSAHVADGVERGEDPEKRGRKGEEDPRRVDPERELDPGRAARGGPRNVSPARTAGTMEATSPNLANRGQDRPRLPQVPMALLAGGRWPRRPAPTPGWPEAARRRGRPPAQPPSGAATRSRRARTMATFKTPATMMATGEHGEDRTSNMEAGDRPRDGGHFLRGGVGLGVSRRPSPGPGRSRPRRGGTRR
jgi:hypothetical protein